MNLIALVAAWTIYFALHSVLASRSIKDKAKRLMGEYFKYYRIAYVVVATVGLLLILIYNSSIHSEDLIDRKGIVRYASLVFAAFGVIIFKTAFRSYRLSSFLGMKEEDEKTLITKGILESVRHPLYAATILLVIGFWLFSPTVPTLISSICIFIYLPIGIALEEKKLIAIFGQQYRSYRKRVPALLPKLW